MTVTDTPHFLPAVQTPARHAPHLTGVENMNNNLDEQPRSVRLLRDPLRNKGSALIEVGRDQASSGAHSSARQTNNRADLDVLCRRAIRATI